MGHKIFKFISKFVEHVSTTFLNFVYDLLFLVGIDDKDVVDDAYNYNMHIHLL